MFANDIKVDAIISVPKKVPKATTKPRTALFQEGGDDVATRASSATTRTRERLHDIVLFAQEKKDGKGILGVAPYAKSANTNLNGEIPVKLVVPEVFFFIES